MINTLSIRSYNRQRKGHVHDYHQLVLPLRGVINISVESFIGKVAPAECVVVKSGEMHHFDAQAEAKFVVADLDKLPDDILQSDTIVFSINQPLLQYLSFVEAQLKFQINPQVEQLMFDTFYTLLSEQKLFRKTDARVRAALEHIESHLSQELSISQLASVACLSPTQFKKIFKEQIGETVTSYIIRLRMEKAQALLLHTDYPVQIVAESVGYADLSAFSRRFSLQFGISPSKYSR
ncbi:helix-turn-helix domain-containing protein [Vibrio sp. HN007]|uniref:AraC family transcriptional regulator n=1 Tax=Vibrio iocasae TaxID=3098914 RepID=UPI0035D3FEAA